MTKNIDELIARVYSLDTDTCRDAIAELTNLREPRAVPPLCDALCRPNDKYVRLAAAGALGNFGDPSAIPFLIAALSDWHVPVRWAALRSLGRIGPAAAEPLVAALCSMDSLMLADLAYVPVQTLVQIGPAAVAPLVAALRHPEPKIRGIAADALGEIGDPRALPELERVVRSEPTYGASWSGGSVKGVARDAIEKIRRHC